MPSPPCHFQCLAVALLLSAAAHGFPHLNKIKKHIKLISKLNFQTKFSSSPRWGRPSRISCFVLYFSFPRRAWLQFPSHWQNNNFKQTAKVYKVNLSQWTKNTEFFLLMYLPFCCSISFYHNSFVNLISQCFKLGWSCKSSLCVILWVVSCF